MQLIRGTLTGSTLIAALAIGGLAQAKDDHPPAPPKPYHSEHAGEHQANPAGAASRERTMEMQRSLAARNLYQGKVDGVWGPKTESALRNFQTQNGLEATGRLDTPSAVALGMEADKQDKQDKQNVSGTDAPRAAPQSGTVVKQTQPQLEDSSTNVQLNTLTAEQGKEMQQRLQLLGYYRGEVDGVVGEGTRAALQRFFQRQADLAARGVISNAAIGLFGTEPADVEPVKGTDTKP